MLASAVREKSIRASRLSVKGHDVTLFRLTLWASLLLHARVHQLEADELDEIVDEFNELEDSQDGDADPQTDLPSEIADQGVYLEEENNKIGIFLFEEPPTRLEKIRRSWRH